VVLALCVLAVACYLAWHTHSAAALPLFLLVVFLMLVAPTRTRHR
jgi:multisubunit Na+/H+ antiporter MnhG subunit